MKLIYSFALLASAVASVLISALIFFSCSDTLSDPPPIVDDTFNGFVSYKVAEIFAKNCALSGCPAGAQPVHNLSLESWSKMIKGSHGRPLSDSSGHKNSTFLHDD